MIIKGEVIHGRSLGRKLGFPTANIAIDPSLPLECGVYRSRVHIAGIEHLAVTNIGVKPTVGGQNIGLECHIINFEGDLYGQTIEVELLEKLREEIHFKSVEQLRDQVNIDIEKVKNLK